MTVNEQGEDGPGGPGRKRDAARTRGDIVHAAGRRFAQAGYSHVTLQEIAEDAGITPALIIRYFGSKEGLFQAVAHDNARLEQVIPGWPDSSGTLAGRFADFLIEYWQNEDARWTAMAVIRSLDVEGAAAMLRQETERRVLSYWRTRITDDDAEIRLRLLNGLMMGFGLLGFGMLLDPDPPKLSEYQAAAMSRYLSAMIAVCLDS